MSDIRETELENKEVIPMTHPNCLPSASMYSVCDAAELAAKRNRNRRGWIKKSPNNVHGVSGGRNYWMRDFNVTFGGDTRKFYLTKGGILMRSCSDGFIPVDLVDYGEIQHVAICKAQARIELDISTPMMSSQ